MHIVVPIGEVWCMGPVHEGMCEIDIFATEKNP